MRSTILHPLTLQPIVPLGYRKNGRPIWPFLGGSESPGQPPADPPADPPQDPPAPPADDLGFPPNTPVAEMSVEQQAAYWRNQSKVQQRIAEARKDYDQQKADAEQWRAHQQSQQTPSEQAVNEARAAGRAEALREANENAATAILRATLAGRGKNDDAVTAILRGFNPAGFVAADDVDHGAILAFADSIAPLRQPDQQQRDIGQGRGRGSTGGTSVSAGRERYRQNHPARSGT